MRIFIAFCCYICFSCSVFAQSTQMSVKVEQINLEEYFKGLGNFYKKDGSNEPLSLKKIRCINKKFRTKTFNVRTSSKDSDSYAPLSTNNYTKYFNHHPKVGREPANMHNDAMASDVSLYAGP